MCLKHLISESSPGATRLLSLVEYKLQIPYFMAFAPESLVMPFPQKDHLLRRLICKNKSFPIISV